MDEYDKMVKVQRKWMIIYLAILVIGLGVLPYKQILLGLLLGSIVSVFNIWFLQKRVKRFGEAIAGGRSVAGLGTLMRMLTSVMAIAIALKFDQLFHIYATIIGLVSSYLIMLVEAFIRSAIEAKRT